MHWTVRDPPVLERRPVNEPFEALRAVPDGKLPVFAFLQVGESVDVREEPPLGVVQWHAQQLAYGDGLLGRRKQPPFPAAVRHASQEAQHVPDRCAGRVGQLVSY